MQVRRLRGLGKLNAVKAQQSVARTHPKVSVTGLGDGEGGVVRYAVAVQPGLDQKVQMAGERRGEERAGANGQDERGQRHSETHAAKFKLRYDSGFHSVAHRGR